MTPRELFGRHPILAALNDDEARHLLARSTVRRFSAGTALFYKDDPGDGLYGVLAGRVVISVGSETGKELILNLFGPGEFFGEIALLDGKGRTGTATAREDSELLFLSRAVFLPFLKQQPEIAFRIIALLCERLRRTTDLVEDSAFLDTARRLAKQLVVLGHEGNEIHLSQAELAQMLGVSREIVSRQLAVWREAGIVELGRGRIMVRDSGALDRFVLGGYADHRP
jgi:CRP/FNR family cyclic AMP-dependent transcriptional regulator